MNVTEKVSANTSHTHTICQTDSLPALFSLSPPFSSSHSPAHPFPKNDKENSQQPQNQWSWAFIYGVIAGLAYLLTSRTEPIPEISFPFFLQHMLHAGEVGVE